MSIATEPAGEARLRTRLFDQFLLFGLVFLRLVRRRCRALAEGEGELVRFIH